MCFGVKNFGLTLVLVLAFSFFLSFSEINVVCADVQTIIVPDDYTTINAAVEAATDGDTIYVKKGMYNETLEIWKALTLIGEDMKTTVINGQNSGTVILIRQNNVNFTGFTVIYDESPNSPDPWFLWSSRLVGIHIIDAKYCSVYENKIVDCGCGIWLFDSSQNNINGNSVIRNDYGIRVESSNNNSITGNTCTSNYGGIWFISASNNKLRANVMVDNSRNFGISSDELSTYVNDVDASNTVDGKPIYYWVDISERVVPSDAGFVVLVNCTGIRVQGLDLTKNQYGLLVAFTQNSMLQNNNISESGTGIYLHNSVNNDVIGNRINGFVGITANSNGTRITNNVINGTGVGIKLDGYRQTITNNTVAAGTFGIGTDILTCSGSYNNITQNSFHGQTYVGVVLGGSYNFFHENIIRNSETMRVTGEGNVVAKNTIMDSGVYVSGSYHIVCANNMTGGLRFSMNGGNNVHCWNYIGYGNGGSIDGFNPDNAHEAILYNNAGTWIQIFDVGIWEWIQYNVDVISNSIVSDFSFNPDKGALIRFNVEGETGKTGFCRVTIPKDLLHTEDNWTVLVDGKSVTPTVNEDVINSYIYFTYQHSTKNVEIVGTTAIPEFPSWTLLPLLLMATSAAIIYKRNLTKKPNQQ